MTTRVEAIDPQHPNIVALMYGPLVLFPWPHSAKPSRASSYSRPNAMARRHGSCKLPAPLFGLLPFTELSRRTILNLPHETPIVPCRSPRMLAFPSRIMDSLPHPFA